MRYETLVARFWLRFSRALVAVSHVIKDKSSGVENALSAVIDCHVTQKVRNSSVVYHKTENPFGAKIGMNSSFQLLLYIIKVKF